MDQPVETWTVRVDADLSGLQAQMARASSEGRQLGRVLTTALQGIALEGKSVTDTLRTLALSLADIALKSAFKPLEQALGGIFQGLIGGGLGGGGGLPIPFAAGGVIASPIAFPLSGGATGIAGERGAEAIMPLSRGPDGRLGVKANGNAGGNVTVTFNVTTPDADSFRRTETQLAAMLSRAIANGQRNL